jgi:nitrogen-specific signal transduction histidine kinase
VLLRHEDGAAEFAGSLTDVTEQRMLEGRLVQSQKMEAIGQLTGGIAHDFNNLLAAVLGGLHILQRRIEFGANEQKIVDQMRRASEQGAELVRRMMAFARKQDLSPASVDPSHLCKSVAGLVEHTLGGTIEIDWQCVTSRSNLFVDKSQLELALLNLILNARDAMPDGGQVTVAIDEVPPVAPSSDSFLRIRVSDHGSGIPDEHIDKIVEPFFTTKEAGKGTGLGLSMVAGFVQQSGGQIRIESEVAKGTTIELILPATPQPVMAVERDDSGAGDQISVRSVLLVDDDEAVRTVLGEQLRELGLAVDCVADGTEALARIANGSHFDLLLTDFAMPGINGLETIRLANERRPEMRAALMTGYADDESTAAARASLTVLRKPISPAELRKVLG